VATINSEKRMLMVGSILLLTTDRVVALLGKKGPMHRVMVTAWLVALVGLLSSIAPTRGADWNLQLAAEYLDTRQKAWFAWKSAASPDGPCVSCHTGMPYLLARPALRRALGEREPTVYEQGLLGRLHAKAGSKPPSPIRDVEVIFTAMFLAERDADRSMRSATRLAFEQLWALQLREGATKGAWRWYVADLDPWEHSGSALYGASLAALAVGRTPADYRSVPSVAESIAALIGYLRDSSRQPGPLHDRVAVLWAASTLPGVMSGAERAQLIREIFEKQSTDGSWDAEDLGPWMPRPTAPSAEGGNSYATAFVAYVLGQAGIAPSHPGLARALTWLVDHQDSKTGAWPASSMNKRYPVDSMQALFMQDAATAFASLALIEAGR
jgi:hypothetical protein